MLILGANGQLARNTTRVFLDRTDVALTLYLRARRPAEEPGSGARTIVEGDVLDDADIARARCRTGRRLRQPRRRHGAAGARHHRRHARAGVKRLIFISSMGIYGEVPGERYPQHPRSLSGLGGPDRGVRSRLHDPAPGLVHARPRRSLTGSRRRASPSRATTSRSTACPR